MALFQALPLAAAALGAAALVWCLRPRSGKPHRLRPLQAGDTPRVAGFELAGTSLFRYAEGGDYYDIFIPAGGCRGRVAVAVGDAAGHDQLAASLMDRARLLLRSRPLEPLHLAETVAGMNRELCATARAGRFMTLFLAVLVSDSRSMQWVSAGHDPAIAYDPGGDRFQEVSGMDIPLGIDPDWRFHELSHTGWPTGAVLLVGTDGIWEARNLTGEMYGKERLRAVLRRACGGSAQDILDAVTADVERFRQGREQNDDVTLVVVKAV